MPRRRRRSYQLGGKLGPGDPPTRRAKLLKRLKAAGLATEFTPETFESIPEEQAQSLIKQMIANDPKLHTRIEGDKLLTKLENRPGASPRELKHTTKFQIGSDKVLTDTLSTTKPVTISRDELFQQTRQRLIDQGLDPDTGTFEFDGKLFSTELGDNVGNSGETITVPGTTSNITTTRESSVEDADKFFKRRRQNKNLGGLIGDVAGALPGIGNAIGVGSQLVGALGGLFNKQDPPAIPISNNTRRFNNGGNLDPNLEKDFSTAPIEVLNNLSNDPEIDPDTRRQMKDILLLRRGNSSQHTTRTSPIQNIDIGLDLTNHQFPIEVGEELKQELLRKIKKGTKSKNVVDRRNILSRNNLNTGGRVLSNDSFQVTGNPGIDTNNFTINGQPVALTQGETVDLEENRVVSNEFRFGGKMMSEVDSKFKKARGSAKDALKFNPNDQEAKNTINLTKSMEDRLFDLQEEIATELGLRDNKRFGGKMKKGMRTGGTIDPPDTDQPGLRGASHRAIINRINRLAPEGIDAVEEGIDRLLKDRDLLTRLDQSARNLRKNRDIKAIKAGAPNPGSITRGTLPPTNTPQRPDLRFGGKTRKHMQHGGPHIQDTRSLVQQTLDQIMLPFEQAEAATLPNQIDPNLGPLGATSQVKPSIQSARLQAQQAAARAGGATATNNPSVPRASAEGSNDSFNVPLSAGDKIFLGTKGVELLGRGIQALQPISDENVFLDDTAITAQNFDPQDALQQISLAENTARQGLSDRVGSFNQLQGNLQNLASNTQRNRASTVERFRQLQNQENARVQQQRSNQARFNAQQLAQQQQNRQANEAARSAAISGLLTSIGNAGAVVQQTSNQQKRNQLMLKVLENLAPDVANDVFRNIFN